MQRPRALPMFRNGAKLKSPLRKCSLRVGRRTGGRSIPCWCACGTDSPLCFGVVNRSLALPCAVCWTAKSMTEAEAHGGGVGKPCRQDKKKKEPWLVFAAQHWANQSTQPLSGHPHRRMPQWL